MNNFKTIGLNRTTATSNSNVKTTAKPVYFGFEISYVIVHKFIGTN
jgi:hypothetical protein